MGGEPKNMEYVASINPMVQNSIIFSHNKKSLEKYRSSVQSIRVNYPEINRTLICIAREIENESRLMYQMQLILEKSTSLYQRYEEKIRDYTDGKQEKDEPKSLVDHIATWSNLWKLVGNFGAVGGAVSGIASFITGSGSAKDNISASKYLVSALGTGVVAVSKGGSDGLRYVAGFNNGLDKIDTSSFGKAIKSSLGKQMDDLQFSKQSGGAGKLKTATKWAGHVLTVAANGVENYNEFKEGGISGERAVAETIVESAVDIGIGIGATAVSTAAVSVIAGVLGVTAAPAVVVGLGAAAITIGANAICKWATGKFGGESKDLGEVAADFVCDVGEGAINLAKKAKNKIKDLISVPWKDRCLVYG